MSRNADLPPRYGYQKRFFPTSAPSTPRTVQRENEPWTQHRRFPTQTSLFEVPPSCLDSLPSHLDTSPQESPLRRTASDPVAVLGFPSTVCGPLSPITEGFSDTTCTAETHEGAVAAGIGIVFEDAYVYGPNSPKQKIGSNQSESSGMSYLLRSTSPESESAHGKTALRRSASDSAAMISDAISFPSLSLYETDGIASTSSDDRNHESGEAETNSRLEDRYVYGPNSPRQRTELTQSESSAVSAVLENASLNPFQYITLDPPGDSEASNVDLKREDHTSVGSSDSQRLPKRHFGQRSRVRKLQYIAELEKTVNLFQTVEGDLIARIASLTKKHLDLSVETAKLKWRLACLQKEKLIKDVEHNALKNEIERLRAIQSCHRRSRSTSLFEMGPFGADFSGAGSLARDMGKLNLDGYQVRHGFEG